MNEHLSALSKKDLEELGNTIEDLKDDGEINGSAGKKTKKHHGKAFFIKIIIVVVILVIGSVILGSYLFRQKTYTQFSSETLLEDIMEIGDLTGAVYTFNGVAEVDDEEGNAKYYVKYYGTVEVGIHFENIKIDIDRKNKVVTIEVPECEFLSTPQVDLGKAEYIFVNEKYNTETVSAEAYQMAIQDLTGKASEDDDLFTVARENVITSIEALTEPLISQLDPEYSVIVK